MIPPVRSRPLGLLIGAWAVAYSLLYAMEHSQLLTNGFDLSVFDYALWSTLHGTPGQVPFLGHSLFAEHFMPTLLAVLPVYALWQSPATLLILQLTFIAVAAVVLYGLAIRKLPAPAAIALTAAFLFSRRTHSGLEAWFHVEALEPLLIFGMVWAAGERRWRWYWACVLLALGCKEDVPVYLGLFGAYLMATTVRLKTDSTVRTMGFATIAVSAVWLVAAFIWIIPTARAMQGLPRANPFMEARFGDPAAPGVSAGVLAERVFSVAAVTKVVNVSSTVAFLCWAAPAWLVPAVPGIAANLAGRPDALQAGLISHYIWPILPWVFLAAIDGCRRVLRLFPNAMVLIVGLLAGITVIDSPLWRIVARQPWQRAAEAARVKDQLKTIPSGAAILALPNLIPHVPHRTRVEAIGRELNAEPAPDYVAISMIGDLWPLDAELAAAELERLKNDPSLTAVTEGPLWVFRRIGPTSPRP